MNGMFDYISEYFRQLFEGGWSCVAQRFLFFFIMALPGVCITYLSSTTFAIAGYIAVFCIYLVLAVYAGGYLLLFAHNSYQGREIEFEEMPNIYDGRAQSTYLGLFPKFNLKPFKVVAKVLLPGLVWLIYAVLILAAAGYVLYRATPEAGMTMGVRNILLLISGVIIANIACLYPTLYAIDYSKKFKPNFNPLFGIFTFANMFIPLIAILIVSIAYILIPYLLVGLPVFIIPILKGNFEVLTPTSTAFLSLTLLFSVYANVIAYMSYFLMVRAFEDNVEV